MRIKAIFPVLLGLFLAACIAMRGAEPPKPPPAQPAVASRPVFFLRDVMPLVNRLGCNSVQCHGAPVGQRRHGALHVRGRRGRRLRDHRQGSAGHAHRPHGARQEPASVEGFRRAYRTAAGRRSRPAPRNTRCCWPGSSKVRRTATRSCRSWSPSKVLPPEQVLAEGPDAAALPSRRSMSDGTKQDVTRLAAFQSTDAKVASVDADGKVQGRGVRVGRDRCDLLAAGGRRARAGPATAADAVPGAHGEQQDRRTGLCQPEGVGLSALGGCRRRRVPAAGVLRRDRHAAHARRRPAPSWPTRTRRSGAS